jgi:hypothetical protein
MSSTEVFQMAVTLALQVKLPIVSATASNPDPAVGEGTRSLNLKVVRILPEAVTAM